MNPSDLTREALSDFFVLERLFKEQGLDALQRALERLLGQVPAASEAPPDGPRLNDTRALRVLLRALAIDAAFLRAHPEALFQCLYNRLRWFDAPDAAQHFTPESRGPWSDPASQVWRLAEHWRRQWESRSSSPWVESLRPLPGPLMGEDRFLAHDARVLCVAFSPSGAKVATGTQGSHDTVHIWDVATGTRLQGLAHGFDVRSVAWSPDGTKLASGARSHDACIWDAETGALLHSLTRQEGQVTSVAFSPDGRTVAAANLGWRVRLIDVATGEVAQTLVGHEQSVLSVAFHPSGRWLATGASDNTVRVWDVATGDQVARVPTTSSVNSVAFSPDGAWLALADVDGVVRVKTEDWTRVPGATGTGPCSSLAWLDSSRLGMDSVNRVEVLDVTSGAVSRARPYLHDAHGRTVAFHPDGEHFALTASDGRLLIGDLKEDPSPALLAEQNRTRSLWGSAEGLLAFARQKRGLQVQVIGADGRASTAPDEYRAVPLAPWKVSPDNAVFACPLMQLGDRPPFHPGVQLFDARTLAPTHTLTAPAKDVPDTKSISTKALPLDFSPDGQLLAAALHEGAVHVWRVKDGALLHRLQCPRGPVSSVEFTPDGAFVVSVHEQDSLLLLHDVQGGARTLESQVVMDPAIAYAAAADAPCIAVGRRGGEVALFDLPSGTERVLHVGASPVIAVGLSASGGVVAASCVDERVRVFDSRTGALRYELLHPAAAFPVALSDEVLVTQADDQRTRFFDLATGAQRAELDGCAVPEDVVRRRYWEALGEGPVAFHRQLEPAPFAHFQDEMEEVLILQEGVVLGRGRAEQDFLYVLKLHEPALLPAIR
ncbi:WD40 repeat domain-containing protein [Corallococcus sp. EGB]|uniref:WD40 repeat domain-containing protein n=1 Tax=Corallococcus sp. EGB TaxID=1521117 RepID=UPI001CC03946|nr:WD40 repeat domain-containing protein [Corallococcus sp. EGB]